MRLVAISDFDDGYPKGLTKKLTNERPDAILACGDFCYGTEIRKAMFANYDSDVQWYDAIGRKKAKQLMYESVEKGGQKKKKKKFGFFLVCVFCFLGEKKKKRNN